MAMNKAVMFFIEPKELCKILNHEQSCVVIHSKRWQDIPKVRPQFLMYLYCTQPESPQTHLYFLGDYIINENIGYTANDEERYTYVDHNKDSLVWGNELNNKVVAECVCDSVEISVDEFGIKAEFYFNYIRDYKYYNTEPKNKSEFFKWCGWFDGIKNKLETTNDYHCDDDCYGCETMIDFVCCQFGYDKEKYRLKQEPKKLKWQYVEEL